jgi:hypothetical protein
VACDQQGRPIEHWGADRLEPVVSAELDLPGVVGVPDMIVEERDGRRGFRS